MSEEQSIVDLAKQGLNAYSSAREGLLQLREQITERLSELQETLEALDTTLGGSSSVTGAPSAPTEASKPKATRATVSKKGKTTKTEPVTAPEIVVPVVVAETTTDWEDDSEPVQEPEPAVVEEDETVTESPAPVEEAEESAPVVDNENDTLIFDDNEEETPTAKFSVVDDIDDIPF